MNVQIPDGEHPVMYVWGSMVPGIGPAAVALSGAVYEHSTLPLQVFEGARLRVAQLNGCEFCLSWKTDRDGETVPDDFADSVAQWRDSTLDDRVTCAIEYAERFVTDHHGIDDEMWSRLHSHFTDAELVELTMCIGSWLSFGRLNRVFGLDTACVLPSLNDTAPKFH